MDNFSNLMMIGECLLDYKRGYAFKKAILSEVKKGDIVLDAGCGSGIMSLFSAKAGAFKVFAVEIDSDIAKIAKNNVSSAGYTKQIEVINKDMKHIGSIVKTPVDVVIMEMMDTGLVSEQQVPAVNALYKAGVVSNKTKFIPSRMQNYLEFTNYNYDFFGFDMPFDIQARNFGATKRVKQYFSEKVKIGDIDLTVPNPTNFTSEFKFKSKTDGVVNSAVLTSLTSLSKDVHVWGTSDMNMPVILRIDPLVVKQNQVINGIISYGFAEGFSKLKITLES